MDSSPSYIIALTGGIACGKSLVREVFKANGFCSFEADEIARAQYGPDTELFKKIIALCGDEICDRSGAIDRGVLAKMVFTDEKKRKALNALVHPVVLTKLEEWMTECRVNRVKGIAEIPLLFECGWEQLPWDKVICVAADKSVVEARLMARGYDLSECGSRMDAQWSVEKKCALADEVIWNNRAVQEVEKKTRDLIDRLR